MPLPIEERALSPHPNPLPWGEGESLADLELANRFWFVLKRAVQFPLPKGEGQGEGKRRAPCRAVSMRRFHLICSACSERVCDSPAAGVFGSRRGTHTQTR